MNYPNDMDPECIPLCDALNAIPSIRTIGSCCGHGKGPFSVWFHMDDRRRSKYLTVVARVLDRRYGGIPGWSCTLDNGDITEHQPAFVISSGPYRGKKAYDQSKKIAENIFHHLGHKAFCRAFLKVKPRKFRKATTRGVT